MIRFHDVNGSITPVENAVLHVSDLSILRGYGVFDFFVALRGIPLFWEDYAARFYNSAALSGLEVPCTPDVLYNRVTGLLRANEISDAGVRLVLTGGYSDNAYTPSGPGNLLILLHPLPQNIWETASAGIRVLLFDYQRELPEAKTIQYATGIRLWPRVLAAGANDLVYHHNGWIRESARSNFLLIDRKGTILSPGQDILHGVTRKHVVEAARACGIPVEIREVHVGEIADAAEAFFTSSTKGVMPVSHIDGKPVGSGDFPICHRLQTLFLERVHNYVSQH
jgi:D-alanine transaminase/branched-chain amino acid aminotransferase